jgi:hypothetical protein
MPGNIWGNIGSAGDLRYIYGRQVCMPSLNEVYEKFGYAAEAAQLFETEIINILRALSVLEHSLHKRPNRALAKKIFDDLDKKTLGNLLFKRLKHFLKDTENIQNQFESVLHARNRLMHTFYRDHGLAKFEEAGRAAMFSDLNILHNEILAGYQTALSISDVLYSLVEEERRKSAN